MAATRTTPPDDNAELMQIFSTPCTGLYRDDALQPIDEAPKQDNFSHVGVWWYVQTQYVCRTLKLEFCSLCAEIKTRQPSRHFPNAIQ